MTPRPTDTDDEHLEEALFEVKRIIVGQDRIVGALVEAADPVGEAVEGGQHQDAGAAGARTARQTAKPSPSGRLRSSRTRSYYLVKPFALPELLARIRALLRREDGGTSVVEVGELRLDAPTNCAARSPSSGPTWTLSSPPRSPTRPSGVPPRAASTGPPAA
ncbi:hypothetical protein ACIHFC_07105 [Streptomyces sp. NPDC052013]|uniref:hypothetical protein n=1 Tax=Streptomyces sp. NPDC052013 TaxID=3365679 RepID=UPI0037D79066